MSRFLGRDLNIDRMAAVVDEQLYRHRTSTTNERPSGGGSSDPP
jgi:hypothetical protein